MKSKSLHVVAFALVIIGGLNLGLSVLGFNIVNMVLGGFPLVEKLAYILVGLSAAYLAVTHSPECKACR